MARGVNSCILIGNLGADPVTRYSPAGACITTISLGTSDVWKDKDGNRKQKTEWHRVVFFGKLAEISNQYLRKGSHVYIEGKLRTRKWVDQAGRDRYTTEIVSSVMEMLEKRKMGGPGGNLRPPTNTNIPSAPRQKKTVQNNAPNFDDFDPDRST